MEQPERDCRHDEEVHCDNAIRMVAKEGLLSLRGRAPPPRHVLGDASLADIDAELEKLSMDSRRPSGPGDFHPESLTDSGLDTLASSGSCHRLKAAAFH